MIIVNFGHFTCQNPEDFGMIRYADEDGRDWYEMRRSLTEWKLETGEYLNAVFGAWALVDPATMLVINVDKDPSRLVPHNKILLGIDASHEDIVKGSLYDGEGLLPPIPQENADGDS